MAGAVAAMVQVALVYAETDAELPVDLQFTFVSDEETGGVPVERQYHCPA